MSMSMGFSRGGLHPISVRWTRRRSLHRAPIAWSQPRRTVAETPEIDSRRFRAFLSGDGGSQACGHELHHGSDGTPILRLAHSIICAAVRGVMTLPLSLSPAGVTTDAAGVCGSACSILTASLGPRKCVRQSLPGVMG